MPLGTSAAAFWAGDNPDAVCATAAEEEAGEVVAADALGAWATLAIATADTASAPSTLPVQRDRPGMKPFPVLDLPLRSETVRFIFIGTPWSLHSDFSRARSLSPQFPSGLYTTAHTGRSCAFASARGESSSASTVPVTRANAFATKRARRCSNSNLVIRWQFGLGTTRTTGARSPRSAHVQAPLRPCAPVTTTSVADTVARQARGACQMVGVDGQILGWIIEITSAG